MYVLLWFKKVILWNWFDWGTAMLLITSWRRNSFEAPSVQFWSTSYCHILYSNWFTFHIKLLIFVLFDWYIFCLYFLPVKVLPLVFIPGSDDGGALLWLSDWHCWLPRPLLEKHHGNTRFWGKHEPKWRGKNNLKKKTLIFNNFATYNTVLTSISLTSVY